MPAGLGALGDDHVGTHINGCLGVLHILHLADQQPACFLDCWREGTRITERQHHRRGCVRQRHVQRCRLGRQRPGDKAAADARIARFGEFMREPLCIGRAATEQPEPASGCHGGGEFAAGRAAHRCIQDRVFDVKPLGQSCAYCHVDYSNIATARIGLAVPPRI